MELGISVCSMVGKTCSQLCFPQAGMSPSMAPGCSLLPGEGTGQSARRCGRR